MPAQKKSITFDEYKSLKDEIIEISEQRFEVLLNNKFNSFEVKILNLIESKFNPKFESIDSKFEVIDSKFEAMDSKFSAKFDSIDSKFRAVDSRFDSLEKRLGFITWFLPAFIGIIVVVMKFVKV